MAKLTAQQIKKLQEVIPEAYRAQMRVSECGTKVFVTNAYERYGETLIRKQKTIKYDRAEFTPDQFCVNTLYGEGRKTRDGAETKDAKGKALDAKTKAGAAALLTNAIAHAEARIEIMQGKRTAKATKSSVSPATLECRRLLIRFAIKNLADDKKVSYTAKTVPSSLVKAKSVDAAKAAAKQLGVPKKKVESLCKRGEMIAALQADDDEEMDVSKLA
jgi:hypothetical protein